MSASKRTIFPSVCVCACVLCHLAQVSSPCPHNASCGGIRNTVQKNQELLKSGMQDPLTENPETSTLNPDIHGVKSRIQDCLGFPLLE